LRGQYKLSMAITPSKMA